MNARWVLMTAVAIAALIVAACCKVSGDCAREEERENAECRMQNAE